MNFPPLNVNNLAIRHVILPNLGPVFLVDNFGLVSADNTQGVVEAVKQYLQTHQHPKSLKDLVIQLMETGVSSLLAATNHSAYAVYKMDLYWGVEFIGTGHIYELASQEQVAEVLGDADARNRMVATNISIRNSLPEPLYVGFTALSQPIQNGYWTGNVGHVNGGDPLAMLGRPLPMQLVTTRIPAKQNSQAVWGVDSILIALEEAVDTPEQSDVQKRFEAVEKRLTAVRGYPQLSQPQMAAYHSLGAFVNTVRNNSEDFPLTEDDVERMEAYIDFIEKPAEELSSAYPLPKEKPIDPRAIVVKAHQFLAQQQADQTGTYPPLVGKIAICVHSVAHRLSPSELFIRSLSEALESAEPSTVIQPVNLTSANAQILGRLHNSALPRTLYQYPGMIFGPVMNGGLSDVINRIIEQRRQSNDVVLLNETHFKITDVSDKAFVITDKTFGGSLTLHITESAQKETLLRRLNGLKELILEGRNALYYTDTILSAGENDFWKLTDTVISGPVKLVGKTVLHNVELRAGSYVDAMIENVK